MRATFLQQKLYVDKKYKSSIKKVNYDFLYHNLKFQTFCTRAPSGVENEWNKSDMRVKNSIMVQNYYVSYYQMHTVHF